MNEQFDKINGKLDKITDHISSIDVTLVKQEENLKEHMRRTDLLEQEVKPIKDHVIQVKTIFKFVTFISGSGALIAAGVKYFLGL